MIELTPNTTPDGEQCGTCRFAGTHTHAAARADQVMVRCRRFPPYRRGGTTEPAQLQAGNRDTIWAITTWDDWCGEWQARDPAPDAKPEPIGFSG